MSQQTPTPADDDDGLTATLRDAKKAAVLELIAEGCNLGEAAVGVGVHRLTLRRWRKDDPEFDRGVRTAFVASVDVLKREAERRAIAGSDKLLMFLLCNYAPDKFAMTQKVEHSGAIDLANAVLAARGRSAGGCPLV